MQVSVEEALRQGWISPKDALEAKRRANPKPGLKTKGKRELEGEEQAILIKEFRLSFPDVGHLLIHIPNGGSRKNAYEGWRLKEQGVRSGVSDLFLPVPKGNYHGLWIEFKAAPPNDAAPSADQLKWLELMNQQGYKADLCLGVDEAMKCLSIYMQG